MNERLTIISNAIYDDEFINLVRPNYQNYLDGQSKIPYYIHAGGDYEYVGFTDYSVNKLEKTLDSSFYKEFIVNIFNRIDNLIDIDFELWGHNNGSLIDIYAIEYVPNDPVIGTAYLWDGWVDIEFRVLDDVRENYITIVHEIGHALGLDHPNGNGFNSNYDIQDTIMSYNDNPSLEDIWFSDADIYTLQRIYGLEEDNNNNGSASFSISGTAAVGNTLSISEDSADPDGTGTLNYAWQTSSDVSNWNVTGTNSTYIVGASEEGKSIRAVLSYMDAQGFNEVVTTPASSIPFVDDGSASFSISGTAAVGNTLSISEDSVDPDGTGTLSYIWQTSSDGNNWNVAGTNSTYIVGASEEGKSIRSVLSYMDAQGFNEVVTTPASSIPFVDDGSVSFSISETAAIEKTAIAKTLTDFEALNYIASYGDLINAFGIDLTSAKTHYTNYGISEGRSLTAFSATNYLAKYSDLSAAFGNDQTLALKHYIEFGYSEGRTDSGSGSSSNLTDFEALNYIASYGDLINVFGTDLISAKSHYTNYGISEGRSLTSFSATDYLAKYSDLSASFGSDQTLALKHYIEYGFSEGRIDTSSSSVSGAGSGESSNLTDFEALNYIASYGDLINAFGTDLTSAKFHYTYYGKSKGLTLDDFDEWGYLASNNDLINSLGSDTTEAVKHYISFGYSQGKITNSFDAQSYLNNYADLRNAFGDNQELATKHYVEYGFNEGRIV